jgi:hypothetical protein
MKPWIFALAAQSLTLLALAQAPKDRIKAGQSPAVSIVPHPTIVFNNGKYAIVENKTFSDQYKAKNVEASCPAGLVAVSAGFSAASGRGEPADFRLILSEPTGNGAGWVIYARYDGKGDALAADFDWELRIHLVCVKLP